MMNKSVAVVLTLGALVCSALVLNGQAPPAVPGHGAGLSNGWLHYRARTIPPVQFQNSGRIESLIRSGQLYLSLQDAIALALENNLDIELQRYGPAIADADLLRTQGGGQPRGVGLSVGETPAGIGGPNSPLLNAAAGSFAFSSSVPANISDLAVVAPGQTSLSISGTTPQSSGPPVPVFDATLIGQFSGTHQTTPQTNPIITGATTLISRVVVQNAGVQKGFSTGTQVSLAYTANSQETNSVRSSVNPFTTASLGLTLVQPLLRGFGSAMNRRFIRVANNNRKVSDLVFRQQVISAVSGVIRLYYDLVSLNEDVRVKQQTLALAQKLQADNEAQFKAGTLAEIEVVRAQAQVGAAREDLINARALAREQELILKTVLTRRGTADPAVRETRIATTDTVPAPGPEKIRPIQDLVAEAFKNRPDLAAAGLQIQNSEISLEGSRNLLRPEVDIVATAQNNGLAGQVNPLATAGGVLGSTAAPVFLGGFGLAVEQLLRRNYPTYGVGIQLSLPLRNRVAEADYARDQLQLRQSQIRRQQLENQVRLEVENAVIALERTRAAYEAAVQTRSLQQQSLASEQKRYAVGISTTFLITQYQSFLAQARSTEVAARGAYGKAQAALQRALGLTLEENGVSIDEAYQGKVARPPVPPALPR
jgi:outer membrane protein TolC